MHINETFTSNIYIYVYIISILLLLLFLLLLLICIILLFLLLFLVLLPITQFRVVWLRVFLDIHRHFQRLLEAPGLLRRASGGEVIKN